MKMKLLVGLTVAVLAAGSMALAVTDYSPQMKYARIYRVALGSGNAPSAAEANLVAVKPGDMVANTDDNALYIMSATNVYTKITAAGLINGVTINTTMITNVIAAGQVLPAVDGSAVTNLSAAQLTAGTAISAVNGAAITNIPSGGIVSLASTKITGGSTYTNAQTGWTNVFINGVLTSHTP